MVKSSHPASTRRFSVVALPLLAFLLSACGMTTTPAPTAGPNGVVLLPGAAVSATIGPAGGELTARDEGRGRSYRLSIPEGAFTEDITVAMTPIAAIPEFPIDGGFLGGVELEPTGTVLAGVATLQIELGSDGQSAVRSALDSGAVIAGFQYEDTPAELAVTLATVAAGDATIMVPLVHFSGHGAGAGQPQSLGQMAPYYARLQAIGGDISDPSVLARYVDLFRDWADALVRWLDASVADDDDFVDAVREATNWQFEAQELGLLTALWYAPGDDLAPEATRLSDAVHRDFTRALFEALEVCRQRQFIGPLAAITHLWLTWQGGILPPDQIPMASAVLSDCLDIKLNPQTSLPALQEGQSQDIDVGLELMPGTVVTDEIILLSLGYEISVAPWNPRLVRLRTQTYGSPCCGIKVAATALAAVPGDSTEGTFIAHLKLFGINDFVSPVPVGFDILPGATPSPATPSPVAPSAIDCTGDPASSSHRLAVVFDGTACSVHKGLSDDDDPDVALALKVSDSRTGWDGGSGNHWRRYGVGDNEDPGPYSVVIERRADGRRWVLTFTVGLTGSGDNVVLSIRDVQITTAGAGE